MKSRPDLFLPDHLEKWYTLDRYHIMGSRILSRSFQVEQCNTSTNDEEDDEAAQADMDVDPILAEDEEGLRDEAGREADGNSDDGDCEDPGDVAMVPMADMLNARFGCNNVQYPVSRFHVYLIHYLQARLFYEQLELKMVTTEPIAAGDQIASSSSFITTITR